MSRHAGEQWYDGIRALHEDHFEDPWPERVRRFNEQFKGTNDGPFWLPHEQCSPPWFNGDIRELKAGEWVLVVSLNPHIDISDESLCGRTFTKEEWWDYWCRFNLDPDHWKQQFFPRLTKLAASCSRVELKSDDTIHEFATYNMLFIEFCPYAS